MSRWSRNPMPVSQRARPAPSRSSETRSAVSVLVRTTYAVRPEAGAARPRAPRAGRRSPRGRRSVMRMPPLTSRTTSPCSSNVCAERLVGAEEDEVAVAFRAVVTGRDERSAHAFPLGDRVRDVDPRVAQRCRADPGRRTAARSRAAGAARAPPPPPARRPPSRREATRSRRPSRASAGRSDSAAQR